MDKVNFPGRTSLAVSRFELDYWENFDGVGKYDLHLPTYLQLFPLDKLNYQNEEILDVGSGAVSVFERLAPKNANIIPFDILANDYNRIAPKKKFMIQSQVSPHTKFSLITMFNMLDHVNDPADLLRFVSTLLRPDGRIWLCVHLGQPHSPDGHPQKFSARSLIRLLSGDFHIEFCGVIREGIPVPYLWYGELLPKTNQSRFSLGALTIRCELRVLRMHAVRAIVKAMKLAGLRRVLPEKWRF